MHGGAYQEVLTIADAVGRAAKALTEVSKIDTCRPKGEPSTFEKHRPIVMGTMRRISS